MITSQTFAGRRYGVFGLARTGRSVVAALAASGAEVWAWDDSAAAREGVAGLVDLNTAPLEGLAALIVSPGVPLNRHPLAERARAAGVPVIGDIELFAHARAELPPHRVVGVTGTNGKSTTCALIHHILVTAGVPTRLAGNIGAPILSEEPLPEGGVYVLELSSFQLDLTFSLDCDVAVLLNITPDHLDRHGTMEAYAAAKTRIFEMQSRKHWAVMTDGPGATEYYNEVFRNTGRSDVSATSTYYEDWDAVVFQGVAYWNSDEIGQQADWPALQGPHNAQNAAAAIATGMTLGMTEAQVVRGLMNYPGLAHRMETVATRRGVRFVNDSKATNPTSVAPALAAFDHIHWIAGGQAKTDELDALAPHLGHVRAAYLIGEAAPLFGRLLANRVPVVQSGVLANAVSQAAAAARPGETVLLSPACASFDQFANYEARGQAFRAAVDALA